MTDPRDTIDAPTLSGGEPTVDDGSFGASAAGDEITGGEGYGRDELVLGRRFGAYELEQRIGSGGMGEVYSARHVESDRQVAIKFLSRTTARLLYRFKREFRALADVSHPNVIRLGELVVPPKGSAYFTMELVDGAPFVEYVRRRARPGELPNLVRLGRALRQLIDGLNHLHEIGCVHRDVKPSNVLVSDDGRVVILDFGLVSELGDDDGISLDGQLLGTPAYMAPEQAALSGVSPATDFYAVGVMLFECLTGVLPFRGSAMEIVLRKQDEDPPDPGDLASGVPPPLRELCMRLLAPEPERRPGFDELLEVLASRELGAGDDSRSPSADKRRERRSRGPFVGRRTELRALNEALEDVRTRGSAVTVHIGGESGVGKSALIARFLAEVRATTEAMILRGRCLERESVPYKGIDSIVDSLSSRLRRMLESDLASLRPRHVAALCQIFEVLGDVWTIERDGDERYEPSEQRRLGLAALREVVTKLASSRPLVIHVDDFQWADVDGARLLASLVCPPAPPALLLIVSFRGSLRDASEDSEALAELTSAGARLGRDVRELELGPLPEQAAAELAATLMGFAEQGSIDEREQARRQADVVAQRARGNPFYIEQMVFDSGASDPEAGDDRIVARRIVSLEPAARHLLALVAVYGGPTPLALIREVYAVKRAGAAAGPLGSAPVGREEAERSWSEQRSAVGELVEQLCELGLLTRRGEFDSSHDGASRSSPALDPVKAVFEAAHARIREVTIGELEIEELAAVHRELGEALERLGGEPEALADHFERAGDLERTLVYSERAAEQAIAALAFGRAVRGYRRAIEVLDQLEAEGRPTDPGRRRQLRLALARQLVNFGRSSEAGRLLAELAREAEQPTQALSLRRDAAEQLLHAGHVGEGLALASEVLREIGEAPPRGFWATMWSFALGRLRLRLRGRGYRVRPASELPSEQLDRFDTLWTINKGLILHLELHSWVLHNRLMRLALDMGEPRRLATMFANEMLVVATSGGEKDVHTLASQARELAARVDDPELDRSVDLQRDLVDYALNRFRRATDQLRELLPRLDDVAGAEWLRLSSVLLYSSLCVITGRWGELYRNLPQWLAAARERGNLREIVELEAYAAMTELHRGDLAQARYHLDNGRAQWDASSYNYTSVMLDRVEVFMLLAEDRIDQVCARIDQLLAAVKRSSVALNPVVKRFVDQLIGRCWTVAALRNPSNLELQARVRKVCRRLRRTKIALYVGEAALFEAALISLGKGEAEVRLRWREAEQLFDRAGIDGQLAAVRWQLARVTDGHEARSFARSAGRYFDRNGVSDPARFAEMLAPIARTGSGLRSRVADHEPRRVDEARAQQVPMELADDRDLPLDRAAERAPVRAEAGARVAPGESEQLGSQGVEQRGFVDPGLEA
ncbi:MAG: protein kinase [Enhygromyxa sp.]